MGILRTPETEKKYKDLIAAGHLDHGCVLCKISAIKTFTHWKIIPNQFPYDRVAYVHHMLIPIRHVVERDFSEDERKELVELKSSYISEQYEYLMEATSKQKTVPEHFHLHLMVWKDLIT